VHAGRPQEERSAQKKERATTGYIYDRADELANKPKEMDMLDDAIEAVRGEEEFILADDDGTAQGEYRPWISEKGDEHIYTTGQVGGTRQNKRGKGMVTERTMVLYDKESRYTKEHIMEVLE
jgi:hypothetical protein